MASRASRSAKAGLPPGSLVYVGAAPSQAATVTTTAYSADGIAETQGLVLDGAYDFTPSVLWIDVDGSHDTAIVEAVGRRFGIHPLVLEDILATDQRPKIEEFDGYLFVTLRNLAYRCESCDITSEQVSIIIGKDFIVSFQSSAGDSFAKVRERIRNPQSRIRRGGPDYLAYALIDPVVDNYFGILEQVEERVEGVEDKVVAGPRPATVREIHAIKRQLIQVRKSVWPLREVVGQLSRAGSSFVTAETALYLRDVYDHTVQVMDVVETLRDIVSGVLDIYLSSMSNRLNEVMKVLTIISTIFIPLSFIASLYGMNFKYMPELEHPWGYPVVLAVMFVLAAGMLLLFRRRRWL